MREYDEHDAPIYDLHSPGFEGDVAFYTEEAIAAGSPVLELGCGTGRFVVPLAQAGVEITGLDTSAAMLVIAHQRILQIDEASRQRVSLVEADMRSFQMERRFRLIMIPYHSFQHVLTPLEQRQTLSQIRQHLLPGDKLIFNIYEPPADALSEFGPENRKRLIARRRRDFTHPQTGRNVIMWDSRTYDLERQTLTGYFIFDELDEAGVVVQRTYNTSAIRFTYRQEMAYLLEITGFSVLALYGDFQRGAYRYGSEQIWVVTPQD